MLDLHLVDQASELVAYPLAERRRPVRRFGLLDLPALFELAEDTGNSHPRRVDPVTDLVAAPRLLDEQLEHRHTVLRVREKRDVVERGVHILC